MEYVLENADLVIFDECDKVQKTLDGFFVPQEFFDKFMSDISETCGNDYKVKSSDVSNDKNSMRYINLLQKSSAIRNSIIFSINEQNEKYKKVLNKTFSSTTLLKKMEELEFNEDLLREFKLLYSNYKKSKFRNVIDSSLDFSNDDFVENFEQNLSDLKISDMNYDDKKFIKLFIKLVAFDKYIKDLEHYYELLDKKDFNENSLLNFKKSSYKKQQKILPSSILGNLFGMRCGENGLELYRQYAFGRALMTEMPYLDVNENGKPNGPHVLLLSGSSYAPGCLEYHINKDVNYILLSESRKAEFLEKAEFIDLCIPDRVSGDYKHRRENLEKVINKTVDSILGELPREGKILLIVNSYDDAEFTLNVLKNISKENNYNLNVSRLSKTKENDDEISRMEISDFGKSGSKILIAPAESIGRGYNIVGEDGHSTFSSVFFLVRPMPIPGDIKQMAGKLAGLIDNKFSGKKYDNLLEKCSDIRRDAAISWSILESNSTKSLNNLDKALKRDIVASVFVTILQIYGRLARVEDIGREPPRIYFADGAFRRNPKTNDDFDLLNEIILYLDELKNALNDKGIFDALYNSFYVAFKRGIRYEERNDNIPDDLYSEEDEM